MPVLPKPTDLITWFRHLLLCTLMLGALPLTWAASSSTQFTPTPADTRLPPTQCTSGQSWSASASTCVASKVTAPQALGSSFAGPRNNYRISKTATGVAVKDINTGISVDLVAPTTLQFADVTVNLRIGDLSKTISAADLKTLVELYIAFFNRMPDGDGLAYWIERYKNGMTLDQIADIFYLIAVTTYPEEVGYSSGMTDADFVRIVYKNVLGRYEGHYPPPEADVQFWATRLATRYSTKGELLRAVLYSAHTLEANVTFYWVPQLLDNKYSVASFFAIAHGLSYNTPNESILKGIAIAEAVAPTSIDAAYNLIGITDTNWNNLDPYSPNPKLESITPAAVMVATPTIFTITGQDMTGTTVMYLGTNKCQTLAGSSSTSFQAVCSATTAGSETAMVRRDGTQADGGLLVDHRPIVTCPTHLRVLNNACVTSYLQELVLMKDSYGREVPEADFGGGDSQAAGADGVAGDGAPITNALVTLVDKLGKVVTTTTDSNGYFRLPIKGMTPPFVASVNRPNSTSWQATHPGPIKPRGFITINQNGLTDKITSDVLRDASANSGNGLAQRALMAQAVKADGVSAVASVIARLSPSELEILLKAARSRLNAQLSTQLTELGLDVATFDPVTTPFYAVLSDPYDQLLERVTVTKDPGTGESTVVLRYTLGGAVNGLTGNGLVLATTGQTVVINRPEIQISPMPPYWSVNFSFPTNIAAGLTYDVVVQTQPSGQTCTVSNGNGIMPASNVNSVVVNCVNIQQYTLGGRVYDNQEPIVLSVGGQTVTVGVADEPVFCVAQYGVECPSALRDFTFPTALAAGTAYNVTLQTQPSGQICTVSDGSGTMPAANVNSIRVTCVTTQSAFSLGGEITGLTEFGAFLAVNGQSDGLTFYSAVNDAPTPFTFSTLRSVGSSYNVTIQTQPSGFFCTVSNGSGIMPAANVNSIRVTCVSTTPTSRYSTVGSYPITDCVKDNTTGLTWEGKPTSGFRASSNTYTNFDSTTSPQYWNGSAYVAPTQSQIDAATNSIGYKNAVNASALCGYTNWRLPSKTELEGLVLTGVGSPTIDTTWFPNTQINWYWTSTPYSTTSVDGAWFVDFGYGYTYDVTYRYRYGHLRLVR